MSETKKVNVGPATRKELDDVIRKAAQGVKAAVEAALDKRYTYRDEGKVKWGAYERYLLSNGHTLYLNLNTKEASVSKEPDLYAQAKVEKRAAKNVKAAERKAAREAKKPVTLNAEEQGKVIAKRVKADKAVRKTKIAAAAKGKTPQVKFDPALSTLSADGKPVTKGYRIGSKTKEQPAAEKVAVAKTA